MENHDSTIERARRAFRTRTAVAGWRVVALVAAMAVAGFAAGSPSGPAAAQAEEGDGAASAASGFARPVYVTNAVNVGDGTNAAVARFAAGPDGRLTAVETLSTALGSRGMVFTPDLRFAYLAAFQAGEITMFRVGPDGALSPNGSVPIEGPFGIAMAPDGRTVYVASPPTGRLTAFAVQPNGGLVEHDAILTGAPDPKEPAVTPDGRFLYISHGRPADPDRDVVVGFALEPDGRLGPRVAEAPAGASGAETMITPDGRFVYVVHQASDEVVGWRIGTDGSLTEVARVTAGDFLEGAAVSPDSRLLYAGSFGGQGPTPAPDPTGPSALLGFRIGANGELTPVAEVPTQDPIGIAFSPDGRRLYASAYTTSTVTTYAVEATGGLSELQVLPSGGLQPAFHSLSILPNRGPVASFTAAPRPAGRSTRFDATTSSDRDGQVSRYDWDLGDGTTLADGGPTPRHTYREPGTYQVRLTVTDNEGCSTRLVHTGQLPHCLGSGTATTTRTITVGR